jgi:phytoene/squalene synthetase
MPSTRELLERETLQTIADMMQDGPNSGRPYFAALAELERRRTLWQSETAESAKATADYTKQNAKYVLWSVIALCVTAGAGVVVQIAALYLNRH